MKKKKQKPKRSLPRKFINALIGIFGFTIFLILILLGFSQTKTFRNYLKEKIQSAYSASLNGRLEISDINGSLLTSINIEHMKVINKRDTLLHIDGLTLNLNPFDLFKKQLTVSKLELEQLRIVLLEKEPGKWNVDEFVRKDSSSFTEINETDSTDEEESPLPFNLLFSHLVIKSSNLTIKDYKHLNSDSVYRFINYGDLRLTDFNLEAVCKADVKKKIFQIELRNLSGSLNTEMFRLKHMKGNFLITDSATAVRNLVIHTSNSEITLSAELDSLSLFKPIDLKNFKNYPVKLSLSALPFDFDDLSTFVESTDILKGKPELKLAADGEFGDMNINELYIKLNDTELNAKGKLYKLETPENLTLDIQIFNSALNESDAVRLLPNIGIPDYNDLKLHNVNIKFKGEPTKFYTKLNAETEEGKIDIAGRMDVSKEELEYDLSFATNNLNLKKIIDIESAITSKGKIKGRGVDPRVLKTELQIDFVNSAIGNFKIDTLALTSTANAKKIELELYSLFNNTEAEVKGNIDFVNNNLPAYNLTGNLNGLNLNDFIEEKKYETDLNFSFVAGGFDLDPDNMTGNFFFEMRESKFEDKDIEDSRMTLFLTKNGKYRTIKLNSDFIDLEFNGEYKLSAAAGVLSSQISEISKIIDNKLFELNPANVTSDSTPYPNIEINSNSLENLELQYSFTLKDFELVSLLLNTKEFDIAGSGKGKIINNSDNFKINGEINLDYMLNADKKSPLFLSKINTDVHFTRDNNSVKFDDLFGSISLSANKIILRSEFNNVIADVAFNGTTILFNGGVNIDNKLDAYVEGDIELTPEGEMFGISDFQIDYNGVSISNEDNIKFNISNNSFYVDKLSLESGKTRLELNGSLNEKGKLDFNFAVSDLSGNKLIRLLLGRGDENLLSNIELTSSLKGTLKNPLINAAVHIDSVGYENTYFGVLNGNVELANNNAYMNFVFSGPNESVNDTLLTLNGNIPIVITNGSGKKAPGFANFNLRTDNFNLAALGNLIPYTKNIKGTLNADVTARGNIDDLIYGGAIEIGNGYFKLAENNLSYNYGVKMKFDKSKLKIESITLENADNTKYKGKFEITGNAVLKGFKLSELALSSSGKLAVLSPATKEVNPNFYGDLVLQSDGKWHFVYKNGKSVFNGNIKLIQTDLTLSPSGQTDVTTSENIIYVIKSDTLQIDKQEKKFRDIVTAQESEKIEIDKSNFDYNFNVKIENEAKIQFLLSKIWNQKLSVLAKGDLKYESVNGVSRAQGALNLEPGSKLDFVKSFDATGQIKFESDLTNPFLEVTALYNGSYNQGTNELPDIIDVQVEMKLNGTLDKLGTNLMKNPNNIAIYKGSRNIENKIRDNRYDISDAILFIYIGRFKEDLTANDKNRLAGLGNTATSFLGSALTSIINSAVGDVVSDIQVDQAGQDTKITISGRYENIRYSVGGTTRIQNIAEANFKIEYQLLPNLLFRLERKNPIVRSFGVEEKISELGLKYRIQF